MHEHTTTTLRNLYAQEQYYSMLASDIRMCYARVCTTITVTNLCRPHTISSDSSPVVRPGLIL
jgi:hypothetical protein